MKTKSLLKYSLFIIPLFLVILILKPVPIVKESNCIVEKGLVERIYESGVQDLSLKLKDNDRHFYINRGMEFLDQRQLSILINRNVTLKYPRYWTPLDPFNHHKHISKLEYDDVVVFDETKK